MLGKGRKRVSRALDLTPLAVETGTVQMNIKRVQRCQSAVRQGAASDRLHVLPLRRRVRVDVVGFPCPSSSLPTLHAAPHL